MTEIYNYSDYRQYIKDYYEYNKSRNDIFSFRYLAQKAGINSSGFFKLIIEGKRNLTKQTILKTCTALKLNDKEAEYFENLVFFNQAQKLEEKNYFFDKLISLQRVKDIQKVREDQYEYYKEWYHCIIRELVVMVGVKTESDYTKIAKLIRPKITGSEVKKSIKLLLDLGFLKVEDGEFFQREPVIATGSNIKAFQVVQFQIKMLEHAIRAFDISKPHERYTSSTTVSFSYETYKKYIGKIRDFRQHLMELARKDENPELVYQLNLNLFPLSENIRGRI